MSVHDDEGGPAFPFKDWHTDGDGTQDFPGMSLRDWFAGQALAGLMARKDFLPDTIPRDEYMEAVASVAFGVADAMLEER